MEALPLRSVDGTPDVDRKAEAEPTAAPADPAFQQQRGVVPWSSASSPLPPMPWLGQTKRVEPQPAKGAAGAGASGVGGQAWIKASDFIVMSRCDVLERTLAAIADAIAAGLRPIVVFDLDSTLYTGAPRTLQILQEWLQTDDGQNAPPALRQRLRLLTAKDLRYGLPKTFKALGFDLEQPAIGAALASADAFWNTRFFSNEYVMLDSPNPGAVAFANAVAEAGAYIVYLTGRDEPRMGDGTRACIERDGFPIGEGRGEVILKPDEDMDDSEFKDGVVDVIDAKGHVVGTFDNEPGNVVVFARAFPSAINTFVDTEYSDKPTAPGHGLYRIEHFVQARDTTPVGPSR